LIALSKNLKIRESLPTLVDLVSDNGIEGAEKQEKTLLFTLSTETLQKRADGNPNTHAFVASPEMVAAVAISGRLDFNRIGYFNSANW
jgi:hypothetical protein